jgi:beta-glucosidase
LSITQYPGETALTRCALHTIMRTFLSGSASLLAGCALLHSSSAYDLVRRQQAANATYKDASAPVEDRVADLLSRMTIEEKTAQLIQGDISNWINTTTNVVNETGLEWNFRVRAGQFYVGYPIPAEWISNGVKIGQDYLLHNTTLGIPAMVQTEAIHGLLVGNATIYNSPIGQACSWDPQLIHDMAVAIAKESLPLGINQLFAPLADLARELRFGRVEETYGEDGFLAGEMAYEYVKGVQSLNVSATVKHFAGFSNPEQGLNTGPVHGAPNHVAAAFPSCYHRRRRLEHHGCLSLVRRDTFDCRWSYARDNFARRMGLQVLADFRRGSYRQALLQLQAVPMQDRRHANR